jgi:hypothetical protein
MILNALTIFTGSFILFLIQPMLGQTLLPAFGGSSAVWSVCMASYTILLLGGYFYAHVLSSRRLRTQTVLHLLVLLCAAAWTWRVAFERRSILAGFNEAAAIPQLEVLGAVVIFIGLPYLALSAGSTLVQAWAQRVAVQTGSGSDVYSLYSISNLGSFLGLFSYPLLMEPYLSATAQWRIFAGGVCVYLVLMATVGVRALLAVRRISPQSARLQNQDAPCPQEETGAAAVLWFFLPGLTSFILLAVTNQFTINVAPSPLLWAGLLGAFLLSYVAGFSKLAQKGIIVLMLMASLALGALAWIGSRPLMYDPEKTAAYSVKPGILSLFVLLTFFHAWLYSLRPVSSDGSKSRLSQYYLLNSVGGAVGGTMAGALSTLLFDRILEFPIAVVLAAVAIGLYIKRYWPEPTKNGLNQVALVMLVVSCILMLSFGKSSDDVKVLFRARDFYGISAVIETIPEEPLKGEIILMHGNTNHGVQRKEPSFRRKAVLYYGVNGGAIAFESLDIPSRRICLIGLGVGVLAANAREGDSLVFYEISPAVVNIASNTNLYTYLSDCKGDVEVRVGDGRKSLEREIADDAPKYDIIVIDTFSGDSIPSHMATSEAFDLYRQRLADGGILAFHISNWQYDLFPLCKAQMERTGMAAVGTVGKALPDKALLSSSWVFFSEEPVELEYPCDMASVVNWQRVPDKRPVTDEFGSMLQYRRRGAGSRD